MIEKVNLSGMRSVLKRFDEDGKFVAGSLWQIANGGYDLWWQLCYQNVPVVDCVRGRLLNLCMPEREFLRVCRVICAVYPDIEMPTPTVSERNVFDRTQTNEPTSRLRENGEARVRLLRFRSPKKRIEILFDEFSDSRDELSEFGLEEKGGFWVEICPTCHNKYRGILKNRCENSGSGEACCSVKGCENTNASWYVDFRADEVELV